MGRGELAMKKCLPAIAVSAIAVAVATSSALQAQQVQVPHVFEAGTPALASEVNANFSILTDAVNANHSAIGGLTGGQFHTIGELLILHPDYPNPIPVVGVEWATSWTVSEGGGGAATPQFGPLVVLRKADINTPELFRHHALQQTFQDITVVMTSPEGIESSYFITNPRISAFETVTTSGGITLERLAFASYDLVQVRVANAATAEDASYCWNVSTLSPC
jgi:type VI protein secretion system component Hcp